LKDWNKLTVSPHATVRDVIAAIDHGGAQIALVVDDDSHLLGTITDGDVRRGLLSGAGLDTLAETIMYREYRWVYPDMAHDAVLSMMREKVIRQIPVVDKNKKILDLYLLEELLNPKEYPNWVILMAGGEGRRLRPLTNKTPKPMLEVGGRPLLDTILGNFVDQGFRKFFISINYLGEKIQNHFGNGEKLNIRINYLQEEEKLGTAGALSLLPARPEHPFIVMNGDVLTQVNFANLLSFHSETKAAATMCLREYDLEVPFGVAMTDGHQVTRIEEKPVHQLFVNAGVYVLSSEVLDFIETDVYTDMPEVLQRVLETDRNVSAFPLHEYWLDIGQHEEFARANAEIAKNFE
jgi:dTDP-glucose pyrophosphorylase